VVNGSVTGKRRQMAVEQFQRNPRTKLFLGNVQAAGTGWDGSCASTTLMAEMPWTPGECIQCDGRPHRIGQRSAVSNYYLVAKDTIEIELCRLLQSKQEVVKGVLDGEHKGEKLTILDELTKILIRRS
jgi:SWI/SNF-related matrix-associated actin-dependent regulator 1 of chromatin subfamily A